jgi:LmbE family N-acetylglucosaminyl deacetylase
VKEVAEFLQFDDYEVAFADDEHHLKLDKMPKKDLMNLIEKESKVSLNKVNPSIVLLPFKHSYNQDHQAVFEAGFAAVRPRPQDIKSTPSVVLVYEQPDVIWSTEAFKPNFFVDITNEIEHKLKALRLYNSQVHPHPHPASLENVKNMASSRGVSIGCDAAEAYQCLRFKI